MERLTEEMRRIAERQGGRLVPKMLRVIDDRDARIAAAIRHLTDGFKAPEVARELALEVLRGD